jgi:hypothetical protein
VRQWWIRYRWPVGLSYFTLLLFSYKLKQNFCGVLIEHLPGHAPLHFVSTWVIIMQREKRFWDQFHTDRSLKIQMGSISDVRVSFCRQYNSSYDQSWFPSEESYWGCKNSKIHWKRKITPMYKNFSFHSL